MTVSAHPQTRFAAALVAAGVVSAAAVVNVPAHPTISVDVANTSAITDALYSLGTGVSIGSSLVGIHVDATISVPFEATLAVMAAARHPELSANVLSYLVQRFVNPAVGPPIDAYPWETEQTFAAIASLLPYPLGPNATDPGAVNEARLAFADLFNGVLGQLPDPMPGFEAVKAVMNDTPLGGALVAGQLGVRAPLYLGWNTVNYLGYLPANLEATLESAIQTPDQIPGLASNLVYGLLSPDASVGLFGKLLDNVVDPFTWLPGPIGYSSADAVGLAHQLRNLIAGAMTAILSVLPTPVRPSALPAIDTTEIQPANGESEGKGSVAPEPAPPTSLARTATVADESIKATEKHGTATMSTPETPAPETEVAADGGKDVKVLKDVKVSKDVKEDGMAAEPGKAANAEPTAHQSKTNPPKTDQPKTDQPKTDQPGGEHVTSAKSDSTGSSHSDTGASSAS